MVFDYYIYDAWVFIKCNINLTNQPKKQYITFSTFAIFSSYIVNFVFVFTKWKIYDNFNDIVIVSLMRQWFLCFLPKMTRVKNKDQNFIDLPCNVFVLLISPIGYPNNCKDLRWPFSFSLPISFSLRAKR